jgi:methylmalonyl-CoA/ethylmalonyl-CoA epimerase
MQMIGNAHIARLGPVMQMAYVPRDLDAALGYWTRTMGVGPFFRLEHIALDQAKYRGEAAEVDFSVCIAYWGDIQIELIEQHNDAPSIYKRWRDEGREGLHHVCIVVDDLQHARAV